MASPIDVFARAARDGAYPGGQLAASRDGKWLVNAAVGLLGPGLEKTHEQVIYDLASLTKPLATAVLVGRAVEQGLADFEDPLSKFLPGADPALTLAHLLEHAAGFPAHMRFDRALPAEIPPGTWDAWRHIVFDALKTPREAPPGAQAVYSDLGFILLGAALEVIFARPLSMLWDAQRTPIFYRDFRGPPALLPVRPRWPIAPTEDCLPGQVHDENCRAMGGAAGHAGLWGTAAGVLAVAEQLVAAYHGQKGKLLQPETARRLFAPSRVPGSTRTLGFDRPSPEGSSTGGRWPAHSVGHLGYTGTSLWIEPERALIVVLVTNRVCPTRANNLIRRVRPALYDAAWETWSKATPKAPAKRPPSLTEVKAKEAMDGPSAPAETARVRKRAPAPRSTAGVRPKPADDDPTARLSVESGPTKPTVRAHRR